MSLSINPIATTTAAGLFSKTEAGAVQGVALDDPAVRFALAGGILDPAAALPLWGGVGISENVPLATGGATTASPDFGGYLDRATSLTATAALGLSGFSVFNQAHNYIQTPQSQVPTAQPGMTAHFYRLGSGARIWVQAAPTLVSIDGGPIGAQVSWDFVNQQLVPYAPAYAVNVISNAVWASTGGGQTTYTVGTNPSAIYTAGDVINVSGVVETGVVAGTTGFNGVKVVKSVGSSTVVVVELGAVAPATYVSDGQIDAGGGALTVRTLKFIPEGAMTVEYDADASVANWNQNGSAALILV